jgi:hypothetical protein
VSSGQERDTMALTKAQKRTVDEIEELLRIGGHDWRVVEELYEPDARLEQLKRIKLDFIRMKVIGDYVFADELLTVVIVAYFFPVRKFPRRWKDKKRLTFLHFVIEELFMLRKLAFVKDIQKFDREMAETLERLNALRNAMAHSFVPEKKRDYRKAGKVTWKGKDIYTTEGVEQFDADMRDLLDYLFQMAFGKKLASFASKLRQALE